MPKITYTRDDTYHMDAYKSIQTSALRSNPVELSSPLGHKLQRLSIMLDTSPEELKFPDLSQIGLAFAHAITYINYQPYPDLDETARQWLIEAGTDIMAKLRSQLDILQQNKDNRVNLPHGHWTRKKNCPLQY